MKQKTLFLTVTALFTAFIAVCAQLVLPLPTGVPVTLQTFAVALCGALLAARFSVASLGVYLLLGLIGAPVFSAFGAGPGVLFGKTGGFLLGFLLLALFTSLGRRFKNFLIRLLFSLIGLLLCHLLGVLVFSAVAGTPFPAAFLAVSLPFLLKDVLSIAAAVFLAKLVEKRLPFSL